MMARLQRITATDWALASVTLCAGVLGVALVMEHAFDMVPCALCLMQRVWFFITAFFVCLGLAHNPRWGVYPLLSLTSAIVGGGFAIRQLYLQALPADQVPSCGPDIQYLIDVFPLSDVLSAMILGSGNCAEVHWQFLGLSIPGWALVAFCALVVLSVFQWRAPR